MQIRMNGQLLLLRLAEMLIDIGCRIIQYNTDGLFLICKKNKKEEYDKVIKNLNNSVDLQWKLMRLNLCINMQSMIILQ